MTVQSTPEVVFESSDWYQNQTAHGLLVLAYQEAQSNGFFLSLDRIITLDLKKYSYSVQDKFKTLWASILVGCDHTVEINQKLGPHEQALAAMFDLDRFPDQSGINRLLKATLQQTVEEFRQLNFELLVGLNRAQRRLLQKRLNRLRLLVIDIDQRGLTVSSKQYQMSESGYFGRKRGHRGYQMSVAYLETGQVLDMYFDPGNTPPGTRIDEMLTSIERYCKAMKIALRKVVVRADGGYGTATIVSKIIARGMSFVIKDISPQRAKALARKIDASALRAVEPTSEGRNRWVADLGNQHFVGAPLDGTKPEIEVRTILVKWYEPAKKTGSRPGASTRARQATEPKPDVERFAALWTNLSSRQLSAVKALEFYDDRATIERYFQDEQYGLGARHVRTHHFFGATVFQWMVAITNTFLRGLRAKYFTGTPIEQFGVGRLIKQAFQVPARILASAGGLKVIFPSTHLLTAWLLEAFAPAQLPLPLDPPLHQQLVR